MASRELINNVHSHIEQLLHNDTVRPLLEPALVILCIIVVHYLIKPRKWKPTEPTIIPSWIPYIGHPINMFWHGGRYFRTLSQRFPSLTILTLPAATSRIYVVTSPALAADVQRKKTLAFDPLVPDLTKRVLGMDNETSNMMRRNVDRSEGNGGPVPEMHDAVAAGLGIGATLDDLTGSAVSELVTMLNDFATASGESSSKLNLLSWTQHLYTICTAKFLYGPENPIARDPALESAFWDFDHGLGSLLLSIWPWLTAPKPYKGREALVTAFKTYINTNAHQQASEMVKKRIVVLERNGFSLDGMARSEVSFLFAGIVNTAVSSFWTVLRIFADKQLLDAIRQELVDAHTESDSASSENIILHLPTIKSSCPLLLATFRESLRLGSDVSSTRLVTADTVLTHKTAAGTYETFEVRKDSVIQISGASMHADPDIYGADVAEFNPHRFLDKARNKSVSPAGFRAFGGGSTLCPGRHLAASEVLAWTAAFIMLFDVEAVGGGDIIIPAKDDGKLPVHVCEPKHDVSLNVTSRGKRVQVLTS